MALVSLHRSVGFRLVSVAALTSLTACASGRSSVTPLPVVAQGSTTVITRPTIGGATFETGREGAVARARADSMRLPYTKQDISFMTDMIHHHAQAITMSRMAPTRGADPAVLRLTARIINAQNDEIRLMQTWLDDRNQPAPKVDEAGTVTMPGQSNAMAGHSMPGHDMSSMGSMPMMPGMLSDAQMKELEKSRGKEYDRLFLTYMIQHHRGAVSMVKDLFAAHGSGQDEAIFKFANDVEVDQSTEIKRMLTMMLEMGFTPPPAPPSN